MAQYCSPVTVIGFPSGNLSPSGPLIHVNTSAVSIRWARTRYDVSETGSKSTLSSVFTTVALGLSYEKMSNLVYLEWLVTRFLSNLTDREGGIVIGGITSAVHRQNMNKQTCPSFRPDSIGSYTTKTINASMIGLASTDNRWSNSTNYGHGKILELAYSG